MSGLPLSEQTVNFKRGDPIFAKGQQSGKSCLVRIYPSGNSNGLIELPPKRYILGRGSDCDLDLGDSAVSRQHAFIEPVVGNFMIADMGSTNGTYVNDEPIDRRFLEAGDLVRIGTNIMKFLSSDHIEAQYHETIYSMMITDGLTKAYNKQYFMESLDRELVRSYRHTRPLSLVMFDIDHFKMINDSNGHLAGDAVLRELGNRVRENVRKDEVFARYGGEEFGVILPESTIQEAHQFAERTRAIIAETPFEVDQLSISVTISVGIAETCGEREIKPKELIADADKKLYEAKEAGRNRVIF